MSELIETEEIQIQEDFLAAMGRRARRAAMILAQVREKDKNRALEACARHLRICQSEILAANELDMEDARKNGMRESLQDRLRLTPDRIEAMAVGLMQVTDLPDPTGQVLEEFTRPNGLRISRVSVPIGVIGIIYEARPNVTADAFALTFKSGNAVILKGGSDAIRSNAAIVRVLRAALADAGMEQDVLQLIEDTSRETTRRFMKMNRYVDLLIPRGGAGLIRATLENSTIPVIETGIGNCHVYVDRDADIDMAVEIIDNAKTQRMGVCNAIESLVIHKDIAEAALPPICRRLMGKKVEVRGCSRTMEIVTAMAQQAGGRLVPATEEDFGTEYGDAIISVKVVDSLQEAIDHINRYTTHHSESIITRDEAAAEKFLSEIDAAAVYVNASTRFTDGFEFGFGAEIGISTQKLHARGPMGLKALTSYKYEIRGNGQVRK